MMHNQDPERHFRVVRFFTDFNAGIIREVIASDLTLDEAEELAQKEAGNPGEEIAVQDQARKGLDAEVNTYF